MSCSCYRLEESFQTLYWALFGYSPPVFADIVVSDVVTKVNNMTVIHPNHHRLTELFGQTMFAIYNVVAIVILLNLLIGLLGNTFNEVKVSMNLGLDIFHYVACLLTAGRSWIGLGSNPPGVEFSGSTGGVSDHA